MLGTSKSTFIQYLVWRIVRQSIVTEAEDTDRSENAPWERLPASLAETLPVRFILRDVGMGIDSDPSQGKAGLFWDALHADLRQRLGQTEGDRLYPRLREKLQERGLFLLDGLDEVPESGGHRRYLLDAVADLAAGISEDARILVSARPYAYASRDHQLPDFQVLALGPLNREQIENYIRHWYGAVAPAMQWKAETARQRADLLIHAIKTRAYLADFASRPLLLTLIASLHASRAQLPEDRAELYEESVELLLRRWQMRLGIEDAQGAPLLDPVIADLLSQNDPLLRQGIEQLAFESHVRQRREETQTGDAPSITPPPAPWYAGPGPG
uniref:NACHT domain-containing protein n=1 Tax=Candidatus Kentrum sp. TUN TaxID=2126343 RepID=A0A451A0H0_9GAMM|nr:MAG: NACHT domain-containing protein [Candidatus Kentron sp. TUN]VFK68009.1 MAG: NACHT domain-containing protein [Candidatus Kentron sp. TUN]